MAENFSELKEDTNLQIQKVQIISSKINEKKSLFRHNIVKLQKATEKEKSLLKAAKGKRRITFKEAIYTVPCAIQ